MSEMMDHLHNTHPQDNEDISAIISSSAQTRMGIESCPLCEVKGDADSPELIDHIFEHVHDFSLRSLPWPKSSEVDLGAEVGSFNSERGEAVGIDQWLEGYEHETKDIDLTSKLSTCDYGRLAIINEQIGSQKHDKLGLDIGFADEHGDESAEAETDISQLTQDTLDSLKQPDGNRELVYCHSCAAEWYRDEKRLTCPKCTRDITEIIEPENDPRDLDRRQIPIPPRRVIVDGGRHLRDTPVSKPSARESTSAFWGYADRLFSRKKTNDIEPQDDQKAAEIIRQFPGLSQTAYCILANLYQQRIGFLKENRSAFAQFVDRVQGEYSDLNRDSVSDLDSFLKVMVKSCMKPLKLLPPKDLTKPISNYFINTSHSPYPYRMLQSDIPSMAIRKALLAGFRSIDIDVWNSYDHSELDKIDSYFEGFSKPSITTKDFDRLFESRPRALETHAEPITTCSWGLAHHFGFRMACQVIRESAFINSDLPVIVNLSVHASPGQQEIMVRIMKEEWDGCLIDEPLEGCDPRFQVPRLQDLLGRILVMVVSAAEYRSRPISSEPFHLLLREEEQVPKYVSIIKPLAELEVYMRSEPFGGFKTPWTKSPGHVFSLPEGQLQHLISVSRTRTDLLQHNQNYFFRVNPNLGRAGTSNLEPLQFWRHGVQMTAISFIWDKGMMLNEGMFADESGWVLKPDSLREPNKDILTDREGGPRKHLDLSIFVFEGQVYQSSTNRRTMELSSLMRASLHIDDEENIRIPSNGSISADSDSGAPGYTINFHATKADASIIPELSILRLTFADYSSDDGLLAWTSLRLDRLNQGYRLVPLYNSEGKLLKEQMILLKFDIKWE